MACLSWSGLVLDDRARLVIVIMLGTRSSMYALNNDAGSGSKARFRRALCNELTDKLFVHRVKVCQRRCTKHRKRNHPTVTVHTCRKSFYRNIHRKRLGALRMERTSAKLWHYSDGEGHRSLCTELWSMKFLQARAEVPSLGGAVEVIQLIALLSVDLEACGQAGGPMHAPPASADAALL